MNMKPKHLIRQLFLSSIMMVAGITSAFAGWGYEKIDGGEGGGGTYTFRNENRYFSYGGDNYDSNHLDWFWTQNDLMETMTYSISNSRCVSAVT